MALNGWRRATVVLTAISLGVGLVGVLTRAVWALADHTAQTRRMAETLAHLDSTVTRLDERVGRIEGMWEESP